MLSRLDQIGRMLPTFPNGLRCNLQNSDGMHSCPKVIFGSLWFLSFGCFVAANSARDLLIGSLINKVNSRPSAVSPQILVYGWNRAREHLAYSSWHFPDLWHLWDSYKNKTKQEGPRDCYRVQFCILPKRSMKNPSTNKQKRPKYHPQSP